jgi:DNA repair protein RecN (Recombination protein N)
MLQELSVKNLAIIEDLQVNFGPGLNVLTGETGAGKSILVGAIGLAMGMRASSEMIRSDCDRAQVQALFDLSDVPKVRARLADADIECNGELIVRRVINKSGKNRIYLNDSLVPLGLLADLGELMINVYGQHESQGLVRPETHLDILDAFGGLHDRRGKVEKAFVACKQKRDRIGDLKAQDQKRASREDYLNYLIREIDSANIDPGELAKLEKKRMRLKGAGQLAEVAKSILEICYESEGSICEKSETLGAQAAKVASFDSDFNDVVQQLSQIAISAEELGRFAGSYLSGIDHDPAVLETTEDRIHEIRGLAKKYGPDEQAILETLAQSKAELADVKNLEQLLEAAKREFEAAAKKLKELAVALSRERQKVAKKMSSEVGLGLGDLDMKGARFSVRFEPIVQSGIDLDGQFVDETGIDKVEFLLSSNPGEPERPIAKIASGGELSRILLVIKNALARHFWVPTLVFDEVDAGIGGKQAETVGRKLRQVSADHQVLCITHLPQIASKADRHYRVMKKVGKGRTTTVVTPLENGERIDETARMLSGEAVTAKTRAAAKEMVDKGAGA